VPLTYTPVFTHKIAHIRQKTSITTNVYPLSVHIASGKQDRVCTVPSMCISRYPGEPWTNRLGHSSHLPSLPLFLPSAFRCGHFFSLRKVSTPPPTPTNRRLNMSARLKLLALMPAARNVHAQRLFSQLQTPTSLSNPHDWWHYFETRAFRCSSGSLTPQSPSIRPSNTVMLDRFSIPFIYIAWNVNRR
jgi:hypothetical protein